MSSPLNSIEKYKRNVHFLRIQRFSSAFIYVSVRLEISAALSRVDWYNAAEIKNKKKLYQKGKHFGEDNKRKNSKELISQVL